MLLLFPEKFRIKLLRKTNDVYVIQMTADEGASAVCRCMAFTGVHRTRVTVP